MGEQYAILMAVFLENNPSLIPTSPSYSNLTSLFDGLNKDVQTEKQVGKTAPITSSLWQSWSGRYGVLGTKQEEALNQIVAKTVDLLIAALGNNTLNQLASRQDLFSQQVLDIFPVAYSIIETYPDAGYRGCKYISGTSPSIYLYPQKPTRVTVVLDSPLTYADPPVKADSWQVTAYPDGRVGSDLISTEGLTLNFFSRLYYEYDKTKVSFTEPKEGFVVKRGEWESFIREKLALKLEFAERETEDLIVDIRNALLDIGSSSYLKISFVDRKELDEKLPINISPQPDTFYRIHLFLTPLEDPDKIPTPNLQSSRREGFTVLELGAMTKE